MNKRAIFTFVILHLFSIKLISCQKKIVCYYTSWSSGRTGLGQYTPSNIDPFLCDVIDFAFAGIDSQLQLVPDNAALLSSVVALKQNNTNLKVLISVGGGSFPSSNFSDLANNATARQIFIQNAVNFITNNNLNGLDLDWEFPTVGTIPADKQTFTTLLSELKTAFTPHGFLLTAAVSVDTSYYEVSNIAQYLDWINLMTYDFHGPWDAFVAFNSPLYSRTGESVYQTTLNVNYTVLNWINQGFPSNKIVLGVPTYGRSYTLANPLNFQPYDASTGVGNATTYVNDPGFASYFEVCQLISSGWSPEWDSQQLVPYVHQGNQWISYENVTSVKLKADYVNNQNLGGAMFWTLDFDDFTGTFCGQGTYPLIRTVKNTINPPVTTTKTPVIPLLARLPPKKTVGKIQVSIKFGK